jgi:hypothetical protein
MIPKHCKPEYCLNVITSPHVVIDKNEVKETSV